ncbi:MAG: 23S rRNA (uracil(1939)-C(5))-methyltransferase RlmD [Patescibacteria group bacterium]
MSSPCPNKERCGSCAWSDVPYEQQLKQKLDEINGFFKLNGLDLMCENILPSPKTDHYRNRMDFVINFEGRVGMREKGAWWKVIDNHTCFLADEQIDRLFPIVREWVQTSGLSFYDRKSHEGILRYAVIRCTSLGQTMINIITSDPADQSETVTEAMKLLNESCRPSTLIHSINKTQTDVSFGEDIRVLYGPGFIEERIDGINYRISPNAFFQTNSFASPLLLQTVRKFCSDLSNKTLLDLYCGTGFFSIALAKHAKSVIGVELSDEAIVDAKENALLNDLQNTQYISAKTEEFDWATYKPDVVILDPPRSGMHTKALADVLRIRPKEIIYVSCNPKIFAKELIEFQKAYTVSQTQAIDQFPHTPHVELVTKLSLRA